MKYTITINQYAAITNGLDLDIADLAIYDFIKDFAHTDKCEKVITPEGVFFWISHKLVIEAMPILNIKTAQGIKNRIEKLCAANVLVKHPRCEELNKTLYRMGRNCELLSFANGRNEICTPTTKLVAAPQNLLQGGHNETCGNNNNKDNNNNIIVNTPEKDFFGNTHEDKSKKTLFSKSEIYALVDLKTNDYSQFEQLFKEPEFEQIDLVYYFHAVNDWSDSSNTKRTRRGWLATIRQFIRGDIDKNKLHTKTPQQAASDFPMDDALSFLNNDY